MQTYVQHIYLKQNVFYNLLQIARATGILRPLSPTSFVIYTELVYRMNADKSRNKNGKNVLQNLNRNC